MLDVSNTPKGTRDECWLRLMSAIYIQAVKDARSRHLSEKSLDAAYWLGSSEAALFLEAIGIGSEPLNLLTSGEINSAVVGRKLNYEQRNS